MRNERVTAPLGSTISIGRSSLNGLSNSSPVPTRPLLVSGAIDSWDARSKWSFSHFKDRYGADTVVARSIPVAQCLRVVKLRDYITYLEAPERSAKGFWIDPTSRFPLEVPPVPPQSPLYLAWNVFPKHPELLDDLQLSPKFVQDWLPLIPRGLRRIMDEETRYFCAGIMMGPAGATSWLHYDFLHSHAYLAQIVGRKRCILFSPEDSDKLYGGKVDPTNPDFERFPLFREVTAYECILEPGEVLLMPSGWWHHVISLEKSITVNYNFFNSANYADYFVDLFRNLPALAGRFKVPPGLKEALGIDWSRHGLADTSAGGGA
jgi:hypothetical protein